MPVNDLRETTQKQQELVQRMEQPKQPIQLKNATGLPDKLKSGIESLSGMAMDDVRVQYNSAKPAQLQAHAYAQGNQIHIAPGQEKHLPHEAWHVVQQKQGRVKPTMQMKGAVKVNDDAGLEREADVMGAKAMGGGISLVHGLKVSAHQGAVQRVSNSAVIQRVPLWAAIKTDSSGKISSTKMDGDRPPGNLRGHTGDHTTPYITFLHMAINNVHGRTLKKAMENLVIVMERIKQMPGYANAGPVTKKPLDNYADPYISWGSSLKSPTTGDVESMMVAVVALRNAVPMSAYLNKVSTGGQNEAGTAGGLHHAESLARAGKPITGNPLVNVFQTFDWGAPGAKTDQEWADLVNQHMLSIRESYPALFELKGLYSLSDMKIYLKNTVLPAQFPKATANNIKALI